MRSLTNRYRSGLERRVAQQISSAGLPIHFETARVNYERPAKACRYVPDFLLPKKDGSWMIIEAKGRFVTNDRQKWLHLQQQHPHLDMRLVFDNANNRISKQSKTTYAQWAETKGFKWATKGIIPQEWLDECCGEEGLRPPLLLSE